MATLLCDLAGIMYLSSLFRIVHPLVLSMCLPRFLLLLIRFSISPLLSLFLFFLATDSNSNGRFLANGYFPSSFLQHRRCALHLVFSCERPSGKRSGKRGNSLKGILLWYLYYLCWPYIVRRSTPQFRRASSFSCMRGSRGNFFTLVEWYTVHSVKKIPSISRT